MYTLQHNPSEHEEIFLLDSEGNKICTFITSIIVYNSDSGYYTIYDAIEDELCKAVFPPNAIIKVIS